MYNRITYYINSSCTHQLHMNVRTNTSRVLALGMPVAVHGDQPIYTAIHMGYPCPCREDSFVLDLQ